VPERRNTLISALANERSVYDYWGSIRSLIGFGTIRILEQYKEQIKHALKQLEEIKQMNRMITITCKKCSVAIIITLTWNRWRSWVSQQQDTNQSIRVLANRSSKESWWWNQASSQIIHLIARLMLAVVSNKLAESHYWIVIWNIQTA